MRKLDSSDRYQVAGELKFHGVTRREEGEVTVEVSDDRTLVVDGEQTFDVRDFDLEPPKFLMLKVHPDVSVRVHVVAEAEG
jgi:polyisoprenoid-binding protein YceI